jgi:dTDP-4-dehydrorhamnose reductase
LSDIKPIRVLVTGAGGQLGRALLANSPAEFSVLGLARADCDITDRAAVESLLERERPGLLINAAAYTAVDRAEEEPEAAHGANATAPGNLASACAARRIRCLHVSTDFVFDGRRATPYPPDADPAPLGVYGASKLAGETAVLASGAEALILRTGWVYSELGHNFLRTMLRLHSERDLISVVADQVGTPTSAQSLAGALWAAAGRPQLSGIYHWSDAGVCSWYDFAQAIGEEALALGVLTKTAQVRPIRSEDYPTPARRPSYSVLDKTRSWRDFELEPRHWRSELRDVLGNIKDESNG